MSYLYQYLLFLAQAVTIAAVLVVVFGALAGLRGQRGETAPGRLTAVRVNEQFDDYRDLLRSMLLDKDSYKALIKAEGKAEKAADKARAKESVATVKQGVGQDEAALPGKSRLFLLDFDGDLEASQVAALRREITALLTVATASDEVLVRLESPGGLVHGYGLAASQLARIRRRGIPLTVAVDRVAASGGYMMACVADRILAAPFAVIGSIGVVAQVPNVHRLLKKNDVDFEVLTAGRYKRTLTVFGENTDEGRAKFLEDLEVTHALFQSHIQEYRPTLDMDTVATGEAWYGNDALARGLVDEILTSDDYLVAACRERDVFRLRWREERKPIERILARAESALTSLPRRWWGASPADPQSRLAPQAQAETTLTGLHLRD
ncbi:MAG: protease SohB [Pseudomonadota bacterium]